MNNVMDTISNISDKVDSHSSKCRAKNPAFCRYHGVKQPMTADQHRKSFMEKAKQLETFDNSDFEAYEKLRTAMLGNLMGYAGSFQSTPKVTRDMMKQVLPDGMVTRDYEIQVLKKASELREEKLQAYSEELKNQLFGDNEDELAYVEHGSMARYALSMRTSRLLAQDESARNVPSSYYANSDRFTPEQVKKYAEENNMNAGWVSGSLGSKTFYIAYKPEDYPISPERYEAVVSNPSFNKRYEQYQESQTALYREDGKALNSIKNMEGNPFFLNDAKLSRTNDDF